MLCDFYELTMGNGYFERGLGDRITYFDLFFRNVPDNGGFAIAAGLEQAVDYVRNLHFTEEDIEYLRSRKLFDEGFLQYLRDFRFTGDIYAVPEGTPVFPREPLLVVRAPAIQAQLLETYLLLSINHQSLIATKSNRNVRAAKGRAVWSFGARRAQGPDGPSWVPGPPISAAVPARPVPSATSSSGERARAAQWPHSWCRCSIPSWRPSRTTANLSIKHGFSWWTPTIPFRSGVARRHPRHQRSPETPRLTQCGIRLDSGDMAYLTHRRGNCSTKRAGQTVKSPVSNALDELLILDLLLQNACIDSFGVGERLITARSEPVFGGVYKLSAMEDGAGNILPKIKISENVAKITTPHFKKLYRFYGRDTGKAIADYLCVYDETVDDTGSIRIFDPEATWKQKTVHNFKARELLVPIFRGGKLVYKLPSLEEIRSYCAAQVETLWDEVKRFDNPHSYYVDLSQKLWKIRYELLKASV
jgi:nicotinate phosphoribosyltransferase